MSISRVESGFSDQRSSSVPLSLVHLLRERAEQRPERIIHTFLPDGIQPGPTRSFGVLDSNARAIAAALQDLHADNERALLFYPPGLEFLDAFFGCLYSGALATPAFPPDPSHLEQTLTRLHGLVGDAQARLILTTQGVRHLLEPVIQKDPLLSQLIWITTDNIPAEQAATWKSCLPKADALAYLQYTSGSTRTPRGVQLTHQNMADNSARICQAFQMSETDRAVIWLPMYHNMGLIGGLLQPLFSGCSVILMSPQAFLQNPYLWLRAMSEYKGTVSGSPNFAFDLCVQRIPPEKREGLDLSTWELAFNGSEAVRPETMERFTRAFEPYGFHRSAFYPCYGLAEATLIVTGGKRQQGPILQQIRSQALEANQVELFSEGPSPASDRPAGRTVVSCGQSLPEHELLIVDPVSRVPLGDDQVGEIWLRGPSISPGYWNRPEETRETFQGFLSTTGAGPYLRTGDLGFLHQNECFITGRLKELIIIRGRNLYPQDIERTVVESHGRLIPNGSAAFAIEMSGEEKLVIVQEIDPQGAAETNEIVQRMRQAVTQAYNVQLFGIALVEPGSIPRTISGKIQRALVRNLFQSGGLREIYRSVLEEKRMPAEVAPQPGGLDNLLHTALLALGPEKSRDLLEAFLREKVAKILKLPTSAIDLHQPLNTLGLDSITSLELAGYIKEAIGVDLPLDEALQSASLSGLVDTIIKQLLKSGKDAPAAEPSIPVTNSQPAAPAQPAEAITDTVREDAIRENAHEDAREFPLTYGQRALWFVQQLHPEDTAHNIVYALTLHNLLDPAALQRSLQKLSQRHAALRTRFIEKDGQPIQRVLPGSDHFSLTFEDSTGWTSEQLEARLNQEVYTPFQLETGPLLRVSVLEHGPQEFTVILALHHIITDLWSMAMIAYDMLELYSAEIQHRPANLKPVRETMAETVKRELAMLSGPEGEKLLAYWKERLVGDLPAMNLPVDHPRPAQSSGRGAYRTIHLDADLVSALRGLASSQNSNLYAVLLSALYTLLYRYTGQTDLLVGTPKAGRGIQNATTAGYFINPVILRAEVNGDLSFSALLKQVYAHTLADFQHDSYPFPLLVEHLQPARNLGTNPLLQIFYSWQKTHRMADARLVNAFTLNEQSERLLINGVEINTQPISARAVPTDLALLVTETETDLGLMVEYSTDLFEPETIERLLGHFTTLLRSMVNNPDQPIGSARMLTEPEHQQIAAWNRVVNQPAEYVPLSEAIQRQAEQTPTATAIISGGSSLTYRALIDKVERLAVKLNRMGIGSGKIIGLCAERSPETVIGLLAILRSGNAYLPLDPEFPAERLNFMISDSGAAAVLTQSWLVERLPGLDIPHLCLDEAESDEGEAAPVNPASRSAEDDLAYIMYTSGTTGQPKGVLIPHGAIAQHCRFMQDYYQYTSRDRVLQFASFNFDASLEQILTPLMAGATLILRDNELWDPAIFSEIIQRLQLTVVNVPPAYWTQWASAAAASPRAGGIPALRMVIIGGDVMSPETLQGWQRTGLQAARLINAYGPTETTITALAYDVPAQAAGADAPIPIGYPLAGRTANILDANQQPVPVGVPGELYIGGDCLAQGYHHQAELTREKFIQDLIAPAPGARMYRTGDLVRRRPDGAVVFLGRIDRQVKILGIRIELQEIEAVLRQHPNIADTSVVDLDGRLVACLVPHVGKSIDLTGVTTLLVQRLPAYMIPASLYTVEALPLLPTGKLDHGALVKMITERRTKDSDSVEGYVPPRNEIEEYIACLWAEFLGVERVGVNDNFFSLGGHSLLATQVISRIHQRYPVDLPLRSLFETPTVAGIALTVIESLAKQEDDEDFQALLDEIEQLPDDE